MPILLGFYPSPRKGKRYRMKLADPHQILDFGFKDGSTFIDHGDEVKRRNYLSRHSKREVWTQINPGSASALILWGESRDIGDNLIQYLDKFDIKVPKGSKIIF
jgi:hypothetical protein